ncbi:MAG: hypothetical protein H0T73_07000, partial [Ardenticatenales bacterium]|nr:hypothetical protein [Ardenticatenales bacterium]
MGHSSLPPHSTYPPLEDEELIDFRPFIWALIRNGWLIGGVAITAAALAFLWLTLRPATYTASADITLLNIRSAVVFDSSFTTIPNPPSPYTEQDDRGDALKALADSPSLMSDVHAQVQPKIDPAPTTIKSALQSEVEGDL